VVSESWASLHHDVVADMPNAHEDVARFLVDQKPDVVMYDVAMPYANSWDLIDVIRANPALQSQALCADDAEQEDARGGYWRSYACARNRRSDERSSPIAEGS
jgi:CheY-like chemotaxis protein